MPRKSKKKSGSKPPEVEVIQSRPGRSERASKALAGEYNFDNCPTEYEDIKEQAVLLGKMSGYAFVMMAHRLLRIRNRKMYRADGYSSFEKFLAGELSISHVEVRVTWK